MLAVFLLKIALWVVGVVILALLLLALLGLKVVIKFEHTVTRSPVEILW
jgi:uncharacterized membrane protein (Fun14 family)